MKKTFCKYVVLAIIIFGTLNIVQSIEVSAGIGSSIARFFAKQIDDAAGAGKTIPKKVDEIPSAKEIPKSYDDGIDIDNIFIPKSVGRNTHINTCPSRNLRVSLPQLNVDITLPENTNIRIGPGTDFDVKANATDAGVYTIDMLNTNKCWVQIRYKTQEEKYELGWIWSKLAKFEFNDHMNRPRNYQSEILDDDDLYDLVSDNTYQIRTPDGQGTAVAISPTVLLTNCHVLGSYKFVYIFEDESFYLARLIHDEKSKDKCFIRSLYLEVEQVYSVLDIKKVYWDDTVYAIGSPQGNNRTMTKGVAFSFSEYNDINWIDATAQVEPGSSGGGLFDNKGNLVGITTLKLTTHSGQTFSRSIAAQDFWR